jgi:hypothetical protein
MLGPMALLWMATTSATMFTGDIGRSITGSGPGPD